MRRSIEVWRYAEVRAGVRRVEEGGAEVGGGRCAEVGGGMEMFNCGGGRCVELFLGHSLGTEAPLCMVACRSFHPQWREMIPLSLLHLWGFYWGC